MKTCILLSFLICLRVFAEAPPKLPADLVQVKSGGHWEEGGKEGFVRFCTYERGFEHVRHKVVIEWIHAPSGPHKELNVVSSLMVEDIPDVWSVGSATFSTKGHKHYIHFGATNTYLIDKHVKYTIELLGIGKIKVTSK